MVDIYLGCKKNDRLLPRNLQNLYRSTFTKKHSLKNFENLVEASSVKPDFTLEVLDGAVVVQAVDPMDSTKFGKCCMNEFTPYLFNKYFRSTLNRVDIVFNIYLDHSIMNSTRNKKGFRKQIEVAADTTIPRHWKSFLCVNENNMQLFQLLESELI